MKILGIESSADDTGIALIDAQGDFGPEFKFEILVNEVSSQTIHAQYGGIFPAMAKQEHTKNLPIIFKKVENEVISPQPDVIAVTVGPGLEPCLWSGVTFAQELAKKWDVPVVGVNHMEGHILISMVENGRLADFDFPALALLISGGHTELILMKKIGSYEYLGRTRDDAVGEAYDKVARMLDLPYPGGPQIARLADHARKQKLPRLVNLPRPMMHADSYEFSFAGLKTAVERYMQSRELQQFDREKIAREFEDAITDVLLYKTLRAVEEHSAQTVILGGGVSANKNIRRVFEKQLSMINCKLLVCPPSLSTDNGLMIALAGYFHAYGKEFTNSQELKANGQMKLG